MDETRINGGVRCHLHDLEPMYRLECERGMRLFESTGDAERSYCILNLLETFYFDGS